MQTVKTAVGEDSPLESLRYIWFDAKRSVAFSFNDVIGLEVPIKGLELDGGVEPLLVDFLAKSTAKETDLTAKGTDLFYGAPTGTKAKLAFRSREGAIQPFPTDDKEPPRNAVVEFDADIVAALKHVMVTGDNAGVTVVPDGDVLGFYSTDGACISWAFANRPKNYDVDRLAFSADFCKSIIQLMGDKGAKMEIFNDGAVVTFDSGVRLIGKLLVQEPPLDFSGRVSAAVPDDAEYFTVPERLAEALEHAELLAGSKTPRIQLELEGAELVFELKTERGETVERCKLAKKATHAVSAAFNASMIHRGLSTAKEFLVTSRGFLLLTPEGFGYITAAVRSQ